MVIEGRMPGLNEYVEAERTNRYVAAKMKKQWTNLVRDIAILTREPRHNRKQDVHFHWVEPNRLRDKDNIDFAKKFIFDGLVKAKVLPNDGWRWVGEISNSYSVDKRHPRVEVTLTDSMEA